MAGASDTKSDHHGTLPDSQTTCGKGSTAGQTGGLIIEMNAIIQNEFYPSLGSNKTRQFDELGGPSRASCVQKQSLQPRTLARLRMVPRSSNSPPNPMQQSLGPTSLAYLAPGFNQSIIPLPRKCNSPSRTALTLLKATCGTWLKLCPCSTKL